MKPSDRVIVEILVAAPIDVVWRALREPAEIKRWFGWDYPQLAEEIAVIFGDEAVVAVRAPGFGRQRGRHMLADRPFVGERRGQACGKERNRTGDGDANGDHRKNGTHGACPHNSDALLESGHFVILRGTGKPVTERRVAHPALESPVSPVQTP